MLVHTDKGLIIIDDPQRLAFPAAPKRHPHDLFWRYSQLEYLVWHGPMNEQYFLASQAPKLDALVEMSGLGWDEFAANFGVASGQRLKNNLRHMESMGHLAMAHHLLNELGSGDRKAERNITHYLRMGGGLGVLCGQHRGLFGLRGFTVLNLLESRDEILQRIEVCIAQKKSAITGPTVPEPNTPPLNGVVTHLRPRLDRPR